MAEQDNFMGQAAELQGTQDPGVYKEPTINPFNAPIPGQSLTDGGPGLSRCVILRGRGGTGKTTCVNAVRAQYNQEEEAVMATTGKAAAVIGGSTVFNSANGLSIPIPGQQYKELSAGRRLMHLQDNHVLA